MIPLPPHLADIPPTAEIERELRSKFLNNPSTPEEHNLTLRYLTASQNGDEQTLSELRHQILARRSRRHLPVDVVPGLDVAPLKEHAWLDSLADDGVRVSSDFYDRLQVFAAPNPPVINLGDDSDSIATVMARDDNTVAVYQRSWGRFPIRPSRRGRCWPRNRCSLAAKGCYSRSSHYGN